MDFYFINKYIKCFGREFAIQGHGTDKSDLVTSIQGHGTDKSDLVTSILCHEIKTQN